MKLEKLMQKNAGKYIYMDKSDIRKIEEVSKS